jgi:hypothetical protein
MIKKISAIIALLFLVNVEYTKAMTYSDCHVLAMTKIQSSEDESQYICEGKSFTDANINYSGKGTTITIKDLNAYYFHAYEKITLEINGNNNISLLHLNNAITVTGTGTLKFKEESIVKKTLNGLPVYSYEYNNKYLIKDSIIYEGTIEQFENDYESLKVENKLKEEFNIEDYNLIQTLDYTNMTSLTIIDTWLEKNIITKLSTKTSNGYGIIEYVEPDNTKLEDNNVVLISEKEVKEDYKLTVSDLKDEEELTTKINDSIEDSSLIGLYDVTVTNSKKQAVMKKGTYTIKIKIDNPIDDYTDYQVIYVNDEGNIEEYLNAQIEDDYIVFSTNHLSQYGIIAKQKEIVIDQVATTKDPLLYFKIFTLVITAIIPTGILAIIISKSKKHKPRKKRA